MSELGVLWDGFASFFSIWQVCILQISPFFMVYIVGLNGATAAAGVPGDRRWLLWPSAGYAVGFSVIFALLSASALPVSRLLTYQIEMWRQLAGVFFLIVAGYLFWLDRLVRLRQWTTPWRVALLSGLLGMAFAVIYSPCITPTLSRILGVAVHAETAVQGAILAWCYGLGLSLSFGVVGSVLVRLLQRWEKWPALRRRGKDGCAIVLFILAIMNLTDIMVYYKAFFLGMLVR
ncbi:MAG: cytochrome c biogenesis protein CcdA [Magnetococcus sp. DMHC-8]